MNDFAQLLQRFRTEQSLSQNALARETGVDPSYVNRIERGERQPPSAAVVRDMAIALQLDESKTSQLLLSAGYAPLAFTQSQATAHPSLQLLTDFLSDDNVLPEDREMIERDIELLEQHIRLIRRKSQDDGQ